jgi:excisionase family DNA binding protein
MSAPLPKADGNNLIGQSAFLDGSVLLTVESTAAWLEISRSSAYELILGGVIDSVKIGKSRRIPVSAIRAYVARQLLEG